jgi:hypothetical protein
MRKLIKLLVRIGLAVAILTAFVHLTDRALKQQDYKLCLQVPKEIRKNEDCESRKP